MLALPLFLQLAIYGITATIVGLALRSLWKYLKNQRGRLLDVLWHPVRLGLLVFVVWILWEMLWFYTIGINDKPDWARILKGCGDNSEELSLFSFCGFYAHMAYFLYLLALSIPKAAVVGILVAFFLKMDPIVRRIIATEKGKPRKKNDNGEPSRIGKWFAGFRPGKIFRRQKKDNQPAPSAEKKQPAYDRPKQMDAVVQGVIVTEKGILGEKKDSDDPLITKKKNPTQKPPTEKERKTIGSIAKSVGTAIGSKVKAVGRTATSARDSVGKIFRRRKKDDQSTPSAEKKPPADDPKEQ